MAEAVWTVGFEMDVQNFVEGFELAEEGLGIRFYSEVLAKVNALERFPAQAPRIKGTAIRRLLLWQRKLGIFYVIHANRLLLHALLDLRQDPQMIRRRLGTIQNPDSPQGG